MFPVILLPYFYAMAYAFGCLSAYMRVEVVVMTHLPPCRTPSGGRRR